MLRPARTLIAAAFALVLVAAPASAQDPVAGTPVAAIAREELAARIEAGTAPTILDVRTTEEYGQGHVPGAINVPHTDLAQRLPDLGLEPGEEVVVYCRSGRRAAIAEGILAEAGFESILDLDGHIEGWTEAGLPVE